MVFKRTVVVPERCDRGHRKATIHAYGKFDFDGVQFQKFRCLPLLGKKHYFSVALTQKDGQVLTRKSSADAPACPKHPGGRVVLNGHKGVPERKRQLYLCHPANGEKPHNFSPPLPRAYVGHGFSDPCDVCEQPMSVHLGEAYGAKKHTWSSHTIAKGLNLIAGGDSFGMVGRWAWEHASAHPRSPRPPEAPTTKHPEQAESNRRWHIAADWVECFTPIIWKPLEAKLRAAAVAERHRIDAGLAAGRPLERPIIWVADEHPVMGKSDELFSILVVGEYEWLEGREKPRFALRLARAMPDKTTSAWLLVLDELAGQAGSPDEVWPDFLVADASYGLKKAVETRFGDRTRWVPSLWHVAAAIRRLAVGGNSTYGRTNKQPLEDHLNLLTRDSATFLTVGDWSTWWDDLEDILRATGVKKSVASRRAFYEPPFARVIPYLAAGGWTAISNAGIEELIKSKIKPLFAKRITFTSVERTNHLCDLAIARSRGEFAKETRVARRLREDAHENGGWAVPTREIGDESDPDSGTRYRSLRDKSWTSREATLRMLT